VEKKTTDFMKMIRDIRGTTEDRYCRIDGRVLSE